MTLPIDVLVAELERLMADVAAKRAVVEAEMEAATARGHLTSYGQLPSWEFYAKANQEYQQTIADKLPTLLSALREKRMNTQEGG